MGITIVDVAIGHQDIAFLNIGTAMSRGAAYAVRATQSFEQSIARLFA